MLQNSQVADEYLAVHQEVEMVNAEIDALEKDRSWLENSCRKRTNSTTSSSPSKSKKSSVDWDARKLLESSGLGELDRKKLQQQRGNCLTFHLQNAKATEVLLSKCGANLPQAKNNKRKAPGDTITLGPDNCKHGGAGTSMLNLSLINNKNGSHSAFFFSRDTGKSQMWGRLPRKLYRRMNGEDDIGDLTYLSTGPHGCYYAEFRSGECWWGSAVEDHDFHAIIQACNLEEARGRQQAEGKAEFVIAGSSRYC
jgi:hypothetical protein